MLLNLVHQPSECSDFAGRLHAKAQNDMRGNLAQVPRGTLRPGPQLNFNIVFLGKAANKVREHKCYLI